MPFCLTLQSPRNASQSTHAQLCIQHWASLITQDVNLLLPKLAFTVNHCRTLQATHGRACYFHGQTYLAIDTQRVNYYCLPLGQAVQKSHNPDLNLDVQCLHAVYAPLLEWLIHIDEGGRFLAGYLLIHKIPDHALDIGHFQIISPQKPRYLQDNSPIPDPIQRLLLTHQASAHTHVDVRTQTSLPSQVPSDTTAGTQTQAATHTQTAQASDLAPPAQPPTGDDFQAGPPQTDKHFPAVQPQASDHSLAAQPPLSTPPQTTQPQATIQQQRSMHYPTARNPTRKGLPFTSITGTPLLTGHTKCQSFTCSQQSTCDKWSAYFYPSSTYWRSLPNTLAKSQLQSWLSQQLISLAKHTWRFIMHWALPYLRYYGGYALHYLAWAFCWPYISSLLIILGSYLLSCLGCHYLTRYPHSNALSRHHIKRPARITVTQYANYRQSYMDYGEPLTTQCRNLYNALYAACTSH